jgi:tetratricopeptide (TPR) repeat protein
MNSPDDSNDSRLDQAIANYAASLRAIEEVAPSLSLEQVIEVLVARDAIEVIRQSSEVVTGKSLAQLIQLDSRLKARAGVLAQTGQLADCRRSMQPPESAWWWFLEPPPPPEPWLSRFGWFWNLLTVGCLVVAGTFATSTAQAFSTSGFDLLGTFSTIAQGTGLVLVAGGALTDQGQKAVERIWSSLKVPHRFHAEATFMVAGLLLLASYSIHRNLPQIGEIYHRQGQAAEAEDQWLVARDKYERALKFVPPNETHVQSQLQISLGKIYERLGQLAEAQKYYESAALADNPEGRLRLGRVNLLQALQAALWTGQVDADQQSRLRDAENYLDLTQQNLTDKPQNIEAVDKQQVASWQTRRLREEVYINQGILRWAKAHLDAPDQRAKEEWLDQAEADFKQASDLEYDLPTVPSGRRADCYYKIALYLNTNIKTRNHQELKVDLQQTQQDAENCAASIANQPSHDLYDVFLMSRAMKVIKRLSTAHPK